MLSKISQAEKDKHHVISLICGILKTKQMNKQKRKTHRYRKQYSDCQRGRGLMGGWSRGKGLRGTNFQL